MSHHTPAQGAPHSAYEARSQGSGGEKLTASSLEREPRSTEKRRTFLGFRRQDGSIGTRNYVGVVSTVNCSATVVHRVASHFDERVLSAFPHVDGVVAIAHGSGCGMAGQGPAFDMLQRTLTGTMMHPNFAAVLVVGLGCEVNQAGRLLSAFDVAAKDLVNRGKRTGPFAESRVRSLQIQEEGGTRNTIERAIDQVGQLLHLANAAKREEIPLSQLTVALQCGGSDGLSGVSANPALGIASDRIVEHGGSVILAETPEIFGAEELLTARAVSPEVARKLLVRIAWWKDYLTARGATFEDNPSLGNVSGGISTIVEKSLGAVAKSGSSPLEGVLEYAEAIPGRGFFFMDSPGYDPCSVTGQVASGANVICFTTGRGSAFGHRPVPSIKLCTNSALFSRMREDMDINCGPVADGTKTVQEVGEEIFEHIVSVASGQLTQSEKLGYGDFEFVPWFTGAVV